MYLSVPNYLTYRQGSLPYKWCYDASLTEKGYLKRLRHELRNATLQHKSRSLVNLIRILANQIFHEETDYMLDQTAQFYLLICSYLLATHQVLIDTDMPEEQIHNIIDKSFQKTEAFWVKWFIRLGFWFSRDKMKFLYRISGPSMSHSNGQLFEILAFAQKSCRVPVPFGYLCPLGACALWVLVPFGYNPIAPTRRPIGFAHTNPRWRKRKHGCIF